MFQTFKFNARLLLSTVVTLVCLVATTSMIVLATPDQAGFPDTVLVMKSIS